MRIRRALTVLAAAALAAAGIGAPASHAQPLEAAVKAAFLPKFAPYVSWPGAAPIASGPFTLCVVGRDPFGALLDDAALGERTGGAPIVVRRIDRIDRGAGCQIAFIGGSSRQPVAAALAALGNAPVLTVTDARTANDRGMIHFVLKDGRVRFHIDDAAAARSGLGLSSRLLGLALSVKARGR